MVVSHQISNTYEDTVLGPCSLEVSRKLSSFNLGNRTDHLLIGSSGLAIVPVVAEPGLSTCVMFNRNIENRL
jgi:hypothetical protein